MKLEHGVLHRFPQMSNMTEFCFLLPLTQEMKVGQSPIIFLDFQNMSIYVLHGTHVWYVWTMKEISSPIVLFVVCGVTVTLVWLWIQCIVINSDNPWTMDNCANSHWMKSSTYYDTGSHYPEMLSRGYADISIGVNMDSHQGHTENIWCT